MEIAVECEENCGAIYIRYSSLNSIPFHCCASKRLYMIMQRAVASKPRRVDRQSTLSQLNFIKIADTAPGRGGLGSIKSNSFVVRTQPNSLDMFCLATGSEKKLFLLMFSNEWRGVQNLGKWVLSVRKPEPQLTFVVVAVVVPQHQTHPKKHESVRKEWDGAAVRACQLAFTRTHCELKTTQREQKHGN